MKKLVLVLGLLMTYISVIFAFMLIVDFIIRAVNHHLSPWWYWLLAACGISILAISGLAIAGNAEDQLVKQK